MTTDTRTRHTAGPFRDCVEEFDDSVTVINIYGGDGEVAATIHGTAPVDLANGKLFASAPALLAALEAAVPMLYLAAQRANKLGELVESDRHMMTLKVAQAALAQTRGTEAS